MNTLVLISRFQRLEYAFFREDNRTPLLESQMTVSAFDAPTMTDTLEKVKVTCATLGGVASSDRVVIRSAYGGAVFPWTTRVNTEMLSRFAELAVEAPMHVPMVHLLAKACLRTFSDATVVMAFETAFFADLPQRERRYGIADSHIRRFGYHGLYHQSAAMEREGARSDGPTRTLSLCLEPQPEIAAILDRRAIMVTSGTTPLEGLPGETTCGELDPTIVLTLARKMKWGPEQINDLLTRQSGLEGLVGEATRVDELLSSDVAWPADGGHLPQTENGGRDAARNFLAYRILLAAGAGVAAMGGVDRMVLSGRYAASCRDFGCWLAKRLCAGRDTVKPPATVIVKRSLPRILADQAAAVGGCGDVPGVSIGHREWKKPCLTAGASPRRY